MKRRILYGTVEGERINPRGGESDFSVKLCDEDGENESRILIESSRLRDAGIEYTGARFEYRVTDDGSTRRIEIIPDRAAEEEDLKQQRNLIRALFGGEEED